MRKLGRLSPGLSPHQQEHFQKIKDFWGALTKYEDETGETHKGVLEGLRAEVEDILSREPVDLNRLTSLTAEAVLRLTGKRNF